MSFQIFALILQVLILFAFALLLKRGVSVKSWQDFLDSLSTKGGNIIVLFCGLGVLIGLMIHLTHDGATDAAMMSAAHDMMVGFGAALLGALSGSSSRKQMEDRVQTATMGAQTPSNPPSTDK